MSRTSKVVYDVEHAQPEIPKQIATLSSKNGSGDTDDQEDDDDNDNSALGDILREKDATNHEEEERSVHGQIPEVDEHGNSNF